MKAADMAHVQYLQRCGVDASLLHAALDAEFISSFWALALPCFLLMLVSSQLIYLFMLKSSLTASSLMTHDFIMVASNVLDGLLYLAQLYVIQAFCLAVQMRVSLVWCI